MRRLGAFTAVVFFTCSSSNPPGSDIPEIDLSQVADPRLREAIVAAVAAVQDSPTAVAWGNLGHVYLAHGWPNFGATAYAHASGLEPEEFKWQYFLGRAYSQVDPTKAASTLQKTITLNSEYAPAYVYAARALRDLGRADEATELLESATNVAHDPSVALAVGQLHLAARRYDVAHQYLTLALNADMERGETHTALSQVYLARGDHVAATRHATLGARYFEHGRMRDPVFAEVAAAGVSLYWMQSRGKSRLQEGDYAGALKEYSRAVDDDEIDPMIWNGYGSALLGTGRREEGVRALQRALEAATMAPFDGNVAPENMRLIHTNLGHAYAVVDDLDKAEQQLRFALAYDSTSVSTAYNLALVYYRAGQSAEALATLSRVPHLKSHARAKQLLDRLSAASP